MPRYATIREFLKIEDYNERDGWGAPRDFIPFNDFPELDFRSAEIDRKNDSISFECLDGHFIIHPYLGNATIIFLDDEDGSEVGGEYHYMANGLELVHAY